MSSKTSPVGVFSSLRSSGRRVPHTLSRNPLVSRLKPRAERPARLPAQPLSDQPVIGVTASHALRSGHVFFANPLIGDVRHKVHKLVDSDHFLRTNVDGASEV